jgi:hypothetical protein
MEVVKNYVAHVGSYLDSDQRQDIEAELQQSIEERLEDLSEQKDLTDDDVETVLKSMGHPAKVAAQYAPTQYLIGPELFPSFKAAWLVSIKIVVMIHVAIAVIDIVGGHSIASAFSSIFSNVWYSLVVVTGVITLAFSLLEYSGEHIDWYKNWEPKKLESQLASLSIDRSDNITNLVSSLFALLWFNGVIDFSKLIGQADFSVALAPIWSELYWPINLVLGLSVLVATLELFKNFWTTHLIWAETALSGLSIILLVLLIQQPDLLIVEMGEKIDGLSRFSWSIEKTMFYTLGIILIVELYEFFFQHLKRIKLVKISKLENHNSAG